MVRVIMFLILTTYSFGISTDQGDYEVIKKIKKYYTDDMKNHGMDKFVKATTISDYEGNWIEGVSSLKWTKIETLPQNGIYESPKKTKDNGLYITKKIFKNKRVLLWVNNIGWSGYTYEMYLINENDYKSILRAFRNFNFEKTEDNLNHYFKNFTIIYPEDPDDLALSYSPSSWIYRGGILEYKGLYYFFKGNDFDNTQFKLIRLDENKTNVVYTFATPSFKYSNDLSPEEKIIWGSGELSTLDNKLGRLSDECYKYLTEDEYEIFQSTKKEFLLDRKEAIKHLDFMKILYKKRINFLRTLLKKEKLKNKVEEVSLQDFENKINGEWETSEYIYSSKGGKGSESKSRVDVEINSLDIKAFFKKDLYGYEQYTKYYKIKKILRTTTLNARQRFFKPDHYGSLGGNIDLLPFYPDYYLISLQDQKTKDVVYMVYSTNEKGQTILIFDPDYEIWNPSYKNFNSNKVWLTDGYLLKKIYQKLY